MLKKKNYLLVVTAVIVFSLLLSGMVSAQTTFLSIATGGTSGTYYPVGGAIAKVLNENIAVSYTHLTLPTKRIV